MSIFSKIKKLFRAKPDYRYSLEDLAKSYGLRCGESYGFIWFEITNNAFFRVMFPDYMLNEEFLLTEDGVRFFKEKLYKVCTNPNPDNIRGIHKKDLEKMEQIAKTLEREEFWEFIG